MSFVKGFEKRASWGPAISSAIKEVPGLARSAYKGLKASGGQTVSDVLKLKGVRDLPKAVEEAGGAGKAFKTKAGRKAMAEAAGKAAPAAAVGLGYAAGAKKLYNKVTGDEKPNPSEALGSYYGSSY